MNNAYSAYKKQSISTLTPMEIVVKLYDEAEKQINIAIVSIEGKNYETANKCLQKSQDIVNALRSVLDMSIPISTQLDALYDFFNRQLIAANVKKDIQILKELLPMLAELRDAFSQVANMPKTQVG
ncbi:MAG: flagellar export chaperone FliS [Ruminiclostridium sp.]|nr:flagellar export chaperone FliS [Ruminiclostridium sp.]MBQ8410330.1 flagellar export chaperone FliS [Ruminiclostridium sp.]MBQ8842595.1 flagellar export chaperone FliS [Ruminiclostridium sp.]